MPEPIKQTGIAEKSPLGKANPDQPGIQFQESSALRLRHEQPVGTRVEQAQAAQKKDAEPNHSPISRLNAQQLLALRIGIGAMFLMGLIPPWKETIRLEGQVFIELHRGYQFLFDPPPFQRGSVAIDIARLAVQCVVAAVGVVGSLLVLKKP